MQVAPPQTIVFACVQNAGRSQMAAAFFCQMADPRKATALSAGTTPGAAVHPGVLAAMLEAGIDLGTVVPRLLTPEVARGARWVITMGCGENCPVVPGAERADWLMDDPKGQSLEGVRKIRDEIQARVQHFIAANGYA